MVQMMLGQVWQTFSAGEVLSPYIYVFYVAFIVTFLFTPMMRTVAIYYGIIDEPDSIRKLHRTPVAYLGGVAVFLGWIAGLAISQFLHLHHSELGMPANVVMHFSIIAGACIIVLLGLWDDVYGVRPWTKIGGQVAAALFLLMEGIGTQCTYPLLNPIAVRLGLAPIPQWIILASSSALVIFVVVGCCNATNLMDGLDGLCGGVTAIIAAGFLFIAVHLAALYTGARDANLDAMRIVLGLALLGAVLGFVPYNFNPASIFMGDTGSMFLGFCCATMIILMGQGQHPRWFLASMVMFALPVLDTSLAFARRWVNRRPLFSADAHHFHHQLVARGFTIKQTVLISYGLAIGFAVLGAAMVFMRTRFAGAFYLVIFGSVIVAAYKMGMVHEQPRVVNRQQLSGPPQPPPTVPPIEPGTVLEVRDDELSDSSSVVQTSVTGVLDHRA